MSGRVREGRLRQLVTHRCRRGSPSSARRGFGSEHGNYRKQTLPTKPQAAHPRALRCV